MNEPEARARAKLERIIAAEGDMNGERRKPYYLAALIAEVVSEKAFADYCTERSLEMEGAGV